jgi:hypothetical protein
LRDNLARFVQQAADVCQCLLGGLQEEPCLTDVASILIDLL